MITASNELLGTLAENWVLKKLPTIPAELEA